MKKQVIILVALCCLFTQTAQGDTFFFRTEHRTKQLT